MGGVVTGVEIMSALLEVRRILAPATSKPGRKARDYLEKWLRSVEKLPPATVAGGGGAADLFARLTKKRGSERKASDRVADIATKVMTVLSGALTRKAIEAGLDAEPLKSAIERLRRLGTGVRAWEGVALVAIVLAALVWARRR